MTWFEHWIKRLCKHEAYARFSLAFFGVPFIVFLNKSRKRFKKDPEPEPGNKIFRYDHLLIILINENSSFTPLYIKT